MGNCGCGRAKMAKQQNLRVSFKAGRAKCFGVKVLCIRAQAKDTKRSLDFIFRSMIQV
jgi:hypothetical protein